MTDDPDIRIVPVRGCPQVIETLALRLWKQWGHLNPQDSPQKRAERLKLQTESSALPQTWVAMDRSGEPAGSASLVPCDLESRSHLTPWMASVLVDENFRRRGIGSMLVRRVMREAAAAGWKKIYLFTWDQQKLYAELGWREFDQEQVGGAPVSIMEADLAG